MGDLTKLARQLQRIELRPDERILDAWPAGVPYGERSNATKTGGTLVLTDRRLIFQPLDLPLPIPPRAGAVMPGDMLQSWIDESRFELELGDVGEVHADANRRAALVVVAAGGTMALNISASRTSWVFSKKNVAARDAAITAIRSALDRARSSRS